MVVWVKWRRKAERTTPISGNVTYESWDLHSIHIYIVASFYELPSESPIYWSNRGHLTSISQAKMEETRRREAGNGCRSIQEENVLAVNSEVIGSLHGGVRQMEKKPQREHLQSAKMSPWKMK